MTPEEAQATIDGWIEDIVAAMPPYQKVLPKPERDAIIQQALVKRYERAFTEGGSDKEVLIDHQVHKDVMAWLAHREPRGLYDPQAVLCLTDDICVFMAQASKEHVQQWRDHMSKNPEQGSNYGNMLYADARLVIWDEEKTLAELETKANPS